MANLYKRIFKVKKDIDRHPVELWKQENEVLSQLLMLAFSRSGYLPRMLHIKNVTLSSVTIKQLLKKMGYKNAMIIDTISDLDTGGTDYYIRLD